MSVNILLADVIRSMMIFVSFLYQTIAEIFVTHSVGFDKH